MPKTPEALRERILESTSTGARGRLQARGLARGLIWRNGQLPEGSPRFSEQLREDLLSHAYSLLLTSLELREFGEHEAIWRHGLNAASEAIESAYRRGDREDPERGFHLVVAAAACHLARAAARSFYLCPTGEADNLSTIERLLVLLMRRELKSLERACRAIVNGTDYSDEGVLQRMLAADSDADELLINAAFTKTFARALSMFCNALLTGDSALVGESRDLLLRGVDTASEVRSVETWWVYYLALHFIDDLWDQSLHVRFPLAPSPDALDGGASLWNILRHRPATTAACMARVRAVFR
jgi:hypothetical protein